MAASIVGFAKGRTLIVLHEAGGRVSVRQAISRFVQSSSCTLSLRFQKAQQSVVIWTFL